MEPLPQHQHLGRQSVEYQDAEPLGLLLPLPNVLLAAGTSVGEGGKVGDAKLLDESLLRLDNTVRVLDRSLPGPLDEGLTVERRGFTADVALDTPSESPDLDSAKATFKQLCEEALASLDSALAAEPDYAPALGTKGQLFSAQGNDQEARVYLQRAVELEPALFWAHVELAQVLSRLGRAQEALKSVDKVLNDYPEEVSLLREKGNLLSLLGQHQDAVEPLQRAIESSSGPGSTVAPLYIDHGELFEHLGYPEMALDAYSEAVHLDPNNTYALSNKQTRSVVATLPLLIASRTSTRRSRDAHWRACNGTWIANDVSSRCSDRATRRYATRTL